MFDLNVIPLDTLAGSTQAYNPGLFASAAPKRPARGRAGDLFALLISPIKDSVTLNGSSLQLENLVNLLSRTYFQIPGTVTTALRSVVEVLNQQLLDYNLQNAASGQQIRVFLNLAAIHASQIYLAHCGPTHTFVVTSRNVDHFNDQQLAGRGLGLSRAVSIRFYQSALDSGSLIIFCTDPPPIWSTTFLQSTVSLHPDALKQRLIGQSNTKFTAALIQCQEGSGKVNFSGISQPTSTSELEKEPPASIPSGPVKKPSPAVDQKIALKPASAPAKIPESSSIPVTVVPPVIDTPLPTEPATGQKAPSPRRHTLSELTREASVSTTSQTEKIGFHEFKHERPKTDPWQKIAPFWKWFRKMEQRSGQWLQAVVARLLPGSTEKDRGPSPIVMVFIAIAVPVLIASVGLAVYFQKGRNDQYLYYFAQAQAIAQEASSQTDIQAAHNDWQSALILLQKAEGYKITTDTSTLRSQIQNALDQFDGVVRLTFQPALVDALPKTAKITRMVTNGNDLYMLDSTQGSVIRAFLTGRGYEIDPDFQCGPGQVGNLVISPLIEMAPLPITNLLKAAIIAIDGAGNLVYCQPNSSPVANYDSLTPPGDNWGKITAFTIDNDQLYILDPQTNIGVYNSNGEGSFSEKPDLFFDSPPATLGDVVDIAVNAQDLYLLHSDGHMTLCVFSPIGVEATRCSDPAPYSDPRPAHEPNPVNFVGTQFSQIEYTDPPDPSIFLLDPNTATIYHFSLRLNLQRLLRPQPLEGFSLPGGAATAFYISQSRMVFMAFNNQVVLSYLP